MVVRSIRGGYHRPRYPSAWHGPLSRHRSPPDPDIGTRDHRSGPANVVDFLQRSQVGQQVTNLYRLDVSGVDAALPDTLVTSSQGFAEKTTIDVTVPDAPDARVTRHCGTASSLSSSVDRERHTFGLGGCLPSSLAVVPFTVTVMSCVHRYPVAVIITTPVLLVAYSRNVTSY